MLARAHRTFTPEEYLMLEEQAEYRSEYFNGEIFPMVDLPPGGIIGKNGVYQVAMAGASYNHVNIVDNTVFSLRTQFKGKPCKPHSIDLRTKAGESYTYPDVVVVCGEPQFADKQDTLVNPKVIIEVPSPSTEQTDRTIKLENYKQIETLEEYLLISQNEPRFELYRHTREGWVNEINREKITLPSVGATLTAEEVYAGVKAKD